MRQSLILLVAIFWVPLTASSQPEIDAQREASFLLARAVESGGDALENITLYSDLIGGRDVDDQETRLSLLSLAVASASRSVAFIEAYDRILTQADAQSPRETAESIDALEQVMLAIPNAASEAFTAELADNLPIVEIRERIRQLEQLVSPHLEVLSAETDFDMGPSRSTVADLTRLKNALQTRMEGDADELALLFSQITNSSEVDDHDIIEMANSAGQLETYVNIIEALENVLGLEDGARRMATNEFKRLLHDIGDDVAEDLVGLTLEERQEVLSRHTDDIVEMLRVLHTGAWRTDK